MRSIVRCTFFFFVFIAVNANVQSQNFNLKAVLLSDIARITDHGCIPQIETCKTAIVYPLNKVLNDLRLFKQIANVNLHTYQHTQNSEGYFTLNKWISNTKKISAIYQLSMAVPVDTVFESDNINSNGTKEKFHVETVLHYSYYLIKLNGQPGTLTYQTEKGGGISRYKIGSKAILFMYESVPLEPDWPRWKFKEAIKKMLPY